MKCISMKSSLIQYLFLVCLLVISGCKKDAVNPDDDEPNLNNPILQLENERLDNVVPNETVFVVLQGYIEDEFGNPIADATIKVSETITTTDGNGYFIFEGINVNKSFAVVKATKENYHRNFRTFTPKANTVQTVKIQLLAKGISKNFNSSSGGNLEFESGKVKLDFPSKSIIKRDGSTYNGNVNVIARYMDPDSDNLMSIMPGMLTGLDEDDNVVGMISYGMVTVELTDNSGNMLEVNPDSKVEVKLPASVSGPVTIPLWHFNETYGLWIEAGTATKVGSEYVGEVNHFSTWNLDMKIDASTYYIKVTNEENIPYTNTIITLFDETFEDRYGQVYTDNNGEFTLLNATQNLGFGIVTDCETIEILPTIIGDSMFVVISQGDILNSDSYTLNFTFKDCDNEFYNNKWIQLSSTTADLFYFGQTNAQGQFSFTSILCDLNTSIPYVFNAKIYLDINLGVFKDTTLAITFNSSEQTLDVNFCGIEEDTISDETVVFFSDPGLEQAVRDVLDQQNGPLLYGSVKVIDSLSSNSGTIASLGGIQYLKGLKYLDLPNKYITDIDPISSLINLEVLILWDNQISDLNPISGLINLKELQLGKNEFTNISPLSGLINLQYLELTETQITDINPLSNLINLKRLDLNSDQITSINALSSLSNLEELYVVGAQISNLSSISDLIKLKILYLGGNEISNLSPVSGLINLEELIVFGTQISDLSSLSALVNLKTLNFAETGISNISPLSGLINLKNLYLLDNEIINIETLSGLINLEELNIRNNQIANISSLSGLFNLKNLDLSYNQISDNSPLSGLYNLFDLNLSSNLISNISPFLDGSNLRFLNLSRNQITDLSSLCNLENNEYLYLGLHYNIPTFTPTQKSDLEDCLPNANIGW
jgi:Leucine-rich repeat (LRR) protein